LVQRFTQIPSGDTTINDPNTRERYFTGIEATFEKFAVEAELNLVHVPHTLNFSHATETIRYPFADDILATSYYSGAVGLSLNQVTTSALHDIAFIHHGNWEGVLFVSVGKELATSWTRWCQRIFGVLMFGIADRSRPWIEGNAYYEWASVEGHIAGVGTTFGLGFGNKNVHLEHFHGYGHVRYREVNIQAYYTYAFDKAHLLTGLIDVRVLASNCPRTVAAALSYDIAFGL